MSHYKQIITHLTDTDAYKYSMGQVLLKEFPNEKSSWKLTIRSQGVKTAYLKDEVEHQLDLLCDLQHTDQELDFIASHDWYDESYIRWLRKLRLPREDIHVARDGDNIGIWTDGCELYDHWFEIPTLSIVQELWMRDQPVDLDFGKKRLEEAVGKYNKLIDDGFNFTLSDFGTRRRCSFDWQYFVVKYLLEKCKAFVGTSNVYLAMIFGTKDIGTIAHSMFMLLQAIRRFRVEESQRATFDAWLRVYRGRLGIFLSDTYGFDAFLRDFDLLYAKLADGVRHDSDDPVLWCQILIEFFKQLMIDPLTKTACFSDSLKDDDVVMLVTMFAHLIKVAIGQGTFLTNTVGGNPLNMVMKLDKANGVSTIKLSDTAGKCNSHDTKQIEKVKEAFNYRPLSELAYLKNNPEAIKAYVAEIIRGHKLDRERR